MCHSGRARVPSTSPAGSRHKGRCTGGAAATSRKKLLVAFRRGMAVSHENHAQKYHLPGLQERPGCFATARAEVLARLFPERAGGRSKGNGRSAIFAVAGKTDGFILIVNLKGNSWSLGA